MIIYIYIFAVNIYIYIFVLSIRYNKNNKIMYDYFAKYFLKRDIH